MVYIPYIRKSILSLIFNAQWCAQTRVKKRLFIIYLLKIQFKPKSAQKFKLHTKYDALHQKQTPNIFSIEFNIDDATTTVSPKNYSIFASVLTLWPNGKHVSWNSWTTFVGAFTPAINSVNETICKNTKQNRNEISAQIIILSKFGEWRNAMYKFDLTNSTFGKFVLTNFAQS